MNKKAPRERSRELDQFYTHPDYAASFLRKVQQYVSFNNIDVLLEPSAGTGSFYNLLDTSKRVGLDLEPKSLGIIEQDFFTWVPESGSKVVTIGNPPFGKNSNLAVRFFNHAATFSEAIAFVLPRTFKKASIINRLEKHFHLVYEEIVPDNSFIHNNKPYNVWCCAQIWVKKDEFRETVKTVGFNAVKEWFEIVKPVDADFAIQRVGGRAGLLRTSDFATYSSESHYFIKQHSPLVLDIFMNVSYEEVKYNTAGNPSISPSELIELWLAEALTRGVKVTVSPTLKKFEPIQTLFSFQ